MTMEFSHQPLAASDGPDVYKPEKKRGGIKRLLPRSLLGRSLLIVITPIFLIQAITAIVFFDNHWRKITQRLAYALAGEVAVIARSIEDGVSPDDMNRITGYAAQNLDLLIGFSRGAVLEKQEAGKNHQVWESIAATTLSRELDAQLRKPFFIYADFEEKWVQVDVQLKNGVLNVSLPQRRLFSSSSYIFLIWMFGASVIVSVVAVLFMRNQIRPIRRLAVAAEWFGRGRDAQKFKVEGATEVRQAGQAFLDMRRRIKRQIEQRTTMLAGVSHDLRTPLTRMKLQLALMGNNPDIAALQADVSQMERMIAGYLDFVRGEGDEAPELISLADMVGHIANLQRRQGGEVTVAVPDYIKLSVRPLAFERALSNFVINGEKYGGHVWISAEYSADERVEISIEDNGPGIAPEKYEDVFRPFFRLDESRNLETGGVGLGMAIALDIIHAHGGRVWLERSAAHGGLKVCIRVPV